MHSRNCLQALETLACLMITHFDRKPIYSHANMDRNRWTGANIHRERKRRNFCLSDYNLVTVFNNLAVFSYTCVSFNFYQTMCAWKYCWTTKLHTWVDLSRRWTNIRLLQLNDCNHFHWCYWHGGYYYEDETSVFKVLYLVPYLY